MTSSAQNRHSPTQLFAGLKLERFTLKRRLGQGAFGQVWLASEKSGLGFERPVALKFLLDPMSRHGFKALVREARVASLLRHVNVVAIHSVEMRNDVPFLVMEYVEGLNLSQLGKGLVRNGMSIPRSALVELGIGICDALDHAWSGMRPDGNQLRIVHRDLKPSNVMLSTDGTVKVADFGMAKLLSDLSTTHTGVQRGTPAYMSPEALDGRREDAPVSDLWALGVVLFEFCTEKRFVDPTADLLDMAETVRSRSLDLEISQVEARFPEMAPLCRELLVRDPSLRIQTAREAGHKLRGLRRITPRGGDLVQYSRLLGRVGVMDGKKSSPDVLNAMSDEAGKYAPVPHANDLTKTADPFSPPAGPGTIRLTTDGSTLESD
ncbi:MAG: serine/threonine protein kinase [Deltaproteobacteria bacterium]|nr:serine/threonine protein kinase [Deltaproteobacteria bacterium]